MIMMSNKHAGGFSVERGNHSLWPSKPNHVQFNFLQGMRKTERIMKDKENEKGLLEGKGKLGSIWPMKFQLQLGIMI